MTSNNNNDNLSISSLQNINSNSNINESKISNMKKKDQLPQETFYNLCQDLLRFINRKIVKKYVFPNDAQLPKEKRGLELRADNNWKYYLNNDISEEEKIRDVFKDNYFLSTLQRMTNALNEVTDYIELNQKKINMINDKSKYKEERKNSLNELKNLIDNYLSKKSKGDNSDMNKSDNEENSDKNINEKINEKINELYTLQKYIEGINTSTNKENCPKNEESTIKDETVPLFSNIESSDKIHPSSEKKEIDILINNFRLEEKKGSYTEKKEDKDDNNIYLNKKKEREGKEKNTKNKNKKKKTKNKEENSENKEENNININDKNKENEKETNNKTNNPPIKFQAIPILNPKKESIDINNIKLKEKKIEKDINEEILQQLLKESKENSIDDNAEKNHKIPEKKEVINIEHISNINNNSIKSAEEMFDIELKKCFSENKRDQKDKINIIIKDIVNILDNQKILKIKKYNDRINGPYLAGSYKTFPDLYMINYSKGIDIIYKYKNMLLNKEAVDFSIKEVLGNYLGLNIIKTSELNENDNMVTKIEVECSNKKWGNNKSIKFNILFVDSTFGFNEKIIDEIIMNQKIFLVKAEAEKFMNIGLFLRLWRKKNNLLYLIPEVLDELVRNYICQGKSMLTVVLNVFFELFNKKPEFYNKNNDGDYVSEQKILCDEIMMNIFSKENNEKIDEMKKKIMKEVQDINSKNFDEVFKM